MVKRGKFPKNIDIVLYDEAHNSISPERGKLHGQIAPVEIGLTATPAYDEERHIWNVFDDVIYEMDIQEAIEMGVLSSLRGYVIETDVDVTGVRLKCGNGYLNEKDAERHLNVIARNQAARDFYLDGFKGVPTVAYCLSRRHAEEFAAFLRASYVTATFVHGNLTQRERNYRLQGFENGSYDVITSRDVLIQGWDSERLSMSLNLRPTYSRVVKTHMVGRVIRARPDKESGVVVEFQDNYSKGQQPVLVHHLFNQLQYRQGGLVAAPEKKKRDEEERVRRGGKVIILGDLKVTSKVVKTVEHFVKRVAPLVDSDIDFRDAKLLREILESCSDFDYRTATCDDFYNMHFSHPSFGGTGRTLLRKHLRIDSKTALKMNKEDYENFINFVFENEVCGDILVDETILTELDPDLASYSPFDLLDSKRKQEAVVRALSACQRSDAEAIRLNFGVDGKGDHTLKETASICRVSTTTIQNRVNRGIERLQEPHVLRRFNLSDTVAEGKLAKNMIKRAMDRSIPPHIRSLMVEELIERFPIGLPWIYVGFMMDLSLYPKARIKAGEMAIKNFSNDLGYSAGCLDSRLLILGQFIRTPGLPIKVRLAAEKVLLEVTTEGLGREATLKYLPYVPILVSRKGKEMLRKALGDSAARTSSEHLWDVCLGNEKEELVREIAGLEYLKRTREYKFTYLVERKLRSLAFGQDIPEEVRRAAREHLGKAEDEKRKLRKERQHH